MTITELKELITPHVVEVQGHGINEFYTLEEVVEILRLLNVIEQRELLLAYHKHLDSLNDPTIYNATEGMIDDYLAN